MSVRLDCEAILDSESDSYCLHFTDGDLHSVALLTGEAVEAARKRSGRAIVQLIAIEVAGALYALEAKQKNIPALGLRARRKGDIDDEPRRIIAVDRDKKTVALSCWDGRPGVANEPETLPWADCEYV